MDLYVEEKNKGKFTTPEYLTKKACNFHVTEELLKQILILHAEIEKSALMEAAAADSSVQPNPAVMNVDMCRKWGERYPEAKMTNKQLISIHEMLNYDLHQVGALADSLLSERVIHNTRSIFYKRHWRMSTSICLLNLNDF